MTRLTDALNRAARRTPVWAVYLLLALTIPWFFYQGLTGGLGRDPVKGLEHLYGLWALLDVQGLSRIWADILKRPYITIGMAGFLCLVPLAATSNNWSLRKLGARWRKLHRLTYVAALLAALHFLWLAKGFQLEPLVYAGLVAGLLIYRLPLSGLWQKGPRGWATRKGQQRS